MIGPWRDPISGKWVVAKVVRAVERVLENPAQDLIDRIRIDGIWRALQSTAESSQIASSPAPEVTV